jgi:hypothetical protein
MPWLYWPASMTTDLAKCNSSKICATQSMTNYQASSAVKLEDSTYLSYWYDTNSHNSVIKPWESANRTDDKSLRSASVVTVSRNFFTQPATVFTPSRILALRPDDSSGPRVDYTE